MRRSSRQLVTIFATFILLPHGMLQADPLVLTTLDWPPYEFEKPEGELRGFDVEVLEAAFERVQISIEFKFFPWSRSLKMAKQGVAAGSFSCSRNPDRDEFFIYSAPISQLTYGFFVRRDYDGFEPSKAEEAKGLKVGSVLGWTMATMMQNVGAKLVTYRSEELVLKGLLAGTTNYAFLPMEGAKYRAKLIGISKDLRFININKLELYVCFSKKWKNVEAIVQKFNEGLAAIRKDGTYDSIHAKYR